MQNIMALNERLAFRVVFDQREVKDKIIELQLRQLERGERADGTIQPDYSPVSVQEFGKPPGPYRLFDTGRYYASHVIAAVTEEVVVIFSDDRTGYESPLIERFGPVLGLNEESMVELIDFIKQKYVDYVKSRALR